MIKKLNIRFPLVQLLTDYLNFVLSHAFPLYTTLHFISIIKSLKFYV